MPDTPPQVPADRARIERIRADFPIFTQGRGKAERLVYLDSASSAQKPQAMIDRLVRFYSSEYANIHRGVYPLSEIATAAFEGARATVARFLHAADPAEIVFTRNTTEAINLVTYAWGRKYLRAGDAILLTQLEHHSNLVPWQMLAAATGAELRFIPVDAEGCHVLDTLDELLAGTRIVAFSQVSNTFGTIAPSAEIIARAHAVGALVLVDGAQSAPHMPIDVQALDADFFVASGHKLCGPTGVGILWAKREILESMATFLTGGDMISKVTYQSSTFADLPWRFEAGTSAFAEAIGLAAALDYLEAVGLAEIEAHEQQLTAYALKRLAELEPRGLRIYGPRPPKRRAGIISFTFADIHPHDLASLLAADGICIRAGHHCTMPLMEHMNIGATARASFYLYNDNDDIDALLLSLEKAARIFNVR